MKHQPFDTWIFSDDPIQPEEMVELNNHFQSCEDCRHLSVSMTQVHQTFASAFSPEPAPGFTHRWHRRLSVYRHQRQQRRMWLLALGMFGLAALLSLVILLLGLGQVNWFYEISQVIANFGRLAAQLNHFWFLLQSFNQTLPVFTPIMVVFGLGLFSMCIALIVTWFSSIIQLYQTVN